MFPLCYVDSKAIKGFNHILLVDTSKKANQLVSYRFIIPVVKGLIN